MYIRCIWFLLFIVLTISWLQHVTGSRSTSSRTNSNFATDSESSFNNLVLDELTKSCPTDGIPVCGVRRNKRYVVFPNECLLEAVNKDILQSLTNFKKLPLKQCIYGCQLNCPKLYKPICVLNQKTREKKIYFNLCEITKYACKTNMDYVKLNLRECETTNKIQHSSKLIEKRSKTVQRRPVPCINVFKPVCGYYLGVKSTFRNECLLNAENVKYYRDWRVVKSGICAEDYSNIRKTKETSEKSHSIKKRSYSNDNFVNFPSKNDYDTNNFMDYKSQPQLTNDDVFVYMPTPFQTQFMNHDNPRYPEPISYHKTYDDILNKIMILPTPAEENNSNQDVPAFEETVYKKPMPFSTNPLNYNYMPPKDSIKQLISVPEPSSVNNFVNADFNNKMYYTFENMEPNQQNARISPVSLQTRQDIQNTTLQKAPSNFQSEKLNFENVQYEIESQSTSEAKTTEAPLKTTLKITKQLKLNKQSKKQRSSTKSIECKFGDKLICGVLPDGKVRTFNTTCEMMTANIYLTNTWTKLHDGECENCKNDCSRDYQPICVIRNGINYTMVNDCYFNMGICMDKKSKWKKIANSECERYTRIPDKYGMSKPGFPYTSSFFVVQGSTTEISITNPSSTTASSIITTSTAVTTNIKDSVTLSTNKPVASKFRKSKSHLPKRVVNRRDSSSRRNSSNTVVKQIVNGEDERRPTRISLYGPHSDSYIMRLVNDKVRQKSENVQ